MGLGLADRTLALKLVTDVGDINKQMKGVTSGFKKMGSAAKSWGKAFTGALALGALEALPDAINELNKGFKEGEDAARNLGVTWKNLGLDATDLGSTIDSISGTALDLGFDDADAIKAFDAFLGSTGDVKQSLELLGTAEDLARGKGWSLDKAVKFITRHMKDLGSITDTNRGKAEAWARDHPIEVTAGKITDALENVIGDLKSGKWKGAFKNLEVVGGLLDDLLFGQSKQVDVSKGIKMDVRSGGLIDRMAGVGRQLIDGIIEGMATLGTRISAVWDEKTKGIDWGKSIADAIGNTFAAITADSPGMDKVRTGALVVGGVFLLAMMTAELVSAAIGAVFSVPGLIITKTVEGAVTAVGKAAGIAFRLGMFVAEKIAGTAASVLRDVAAGLIEGTALWDAAIGIGKIIGTAIQTGLVIGVTFGLVLALQLALQEALKQIPIIRDLPIFGGSGPGGNAGGTDSWKGGPTWVGEKGPELLNLPTGTGITRHTDSMRAMNSRGDTIINVNIQSGVGDPVSIGREVNRVLNAYRKRAGIPIAGAMV